MNCIIASTSIFDQISIRSKQVSLKRCCKSEFFLWMADWKSMEKWVVALKKGPSRSHRMLTVGKFFVLRHFLSEASQRWSFKTVTESALDFFALRMLFTSWSWGDVIIFLSVNLPSCHVHVNNAWHADSCVISMAYGLWSCQGSSWIINFYAAWRYTCKIQRLEWVATSSLPGRLKATSETDSNMYSSEHCRSLYQFGYDELEIEC